MAIPAQRTRPVDRQELARQSEAHGWNHETLAKKAGIHIRSLRRILRGKNAYLSTIVSLADALGVLPERLIEQSPKMQAKVARRRTKQFTLKLQITGDLTDHKQLEKLTKATGQLVDQLEAAGIETNEVTSQVAVLDPDQRTRILVLVFGELKSGGPFWVYVAIKPSAYPAFEKAQSEARVDLQRFEPFGEIIVSGEGSSPPEDVTKQVAELYETDYTKISQSLRNISSREPISPSIPEQGTGELHGG